MRLMVYVLVAANFVLLALLCLAVRKIERMYRKFRHRSVVPFLRRLPIPAVPVDQVDAVFRAGVFGATRDTEVHLIGDRAVSGPDAFELWVLAVLAKRAQRMFEFGTCTGRTAYLWARNSPPEAQVTTITLRPEDIAAYQAGAEDRSRDTQLAKRESGFDTFFYSRTDVAHKVRQLYGDSKSLDQTPYRRQMDLIFVDGSHAYSYVASDTRKALEMIRPGGIILWHDYGGSDRIEGVHRFLDELSHELPLRQIKNSTLVFYRQPLEDGETLPDAKAA